MGSGYLGAQDISLRYASSELMTDDPFTFVRSFQASSRSEEVEGVVCAVVVFDSEGQNWGTYVSREPVRFDSGGPLDCWSQELREALPEGRFGRQDRTLSQGLTINAGHVMAQPAPVTADSPIPPHVLAEELRRSTSNLERLADGIGGYPPQMPRHISKEPRWVAASFMVIPVNDSDGRMTLSRDFQSTPVTVLLGGRDR
ncbi:MAG: hypothetical protein R6V27_03070 [Balneolaceae bacterium]